MGYLIVPDLTTGKYMCLEDCAHKDCMSIKRDFIGNPNCKICGKPLKVGDKFYYVEQGKNDKVHFVCEIEQIEKERKVKA
ncbi:hypothetical protein M0R04_08285 [Candidatus Dojkabacteria bacterium]|jgi:hypothetical protein|nr:hypothetical protein [Candidatus Dojkabacteria bacterium]